MKRLPFLLGCAVFAAVVAQSRKAAAYWRDVDPMRFNRWGAEVTAENAWREHPVPRFRRIGEWTNLNGLWQYAILRESDDMTVLAGPRIGPKRFDSQILVPYPVESALSGADRLLEPDEFLWYSREITLKKRAGWRTLLHFEGVDWRAQVFVNGVEAGLPHEGAYESFARDITDLVKDGINRIQVAVWDPTDTHIGASGLQTLRPSGIMYPRASGIWKTVWMESVPEAHLVDYRIDANVGKGAISVKVNAEGDAVDARVIVEVLDEKGVEVVSGEARGFSRPVALQLPRTVHLWSPDDPYLYGIRIRIVAADGTEDVVEGYFGMREVCLMDDENGVPRFAVNGSIVYVNAVAYHGWWNDGLSTPPSEAAMRYDIEFARRAGFNAIRLCGKVECPAFYTLCDRLGMMVLQDMPAGSGNRIARYGEYRRELAAIVDSLRGYPSVVMWIPYNEGWGQPHAKLTSDTIRWLKRHDSTRLVDGPSGWNDFEGGLSHHGWYEADWGVAPNDHVEHDADVLDMHSRPGPDMFRTGAGRASFLGEFGGISLASPASGADEADSKAVRDATFERYRELYSKLVPLARRGLAGSVYCQLADFPGRSNGILNSDRTIEKIDSGRLASLADDVRRAAYEGAMPSDALVLIPRLAQTADTWAWTFRDPGGKWMRPEFNDSKWGRAGGGFGNNEIRSAYSSADHSVAWTTSDLWVRSEFEYDRGEVLGAYVEMFHDEDAQLYLNGEVILEVSGYNTKWELFPLDSEKFNRLIRKGRNVLAAHIRQTTGGQYFDLGLSVVVPK